MSKHALNVDDIISKDATRFMQVAYYNEVPVTYEDNQLVTKGYVDTRLSSGYPDPIITDVEAGTNIPSDGSQNYWTVPYDSTVYGVYPNVKLIRIADLRTAGQVPDVAYVDGEVRIYNLPNDGGATPVVLDATRIVISKA